MRDFRPADHSPPRPVAQTQIILSGQVPIMVFSGRPSDACYPCRKGRLRVRTPSPIISRPNLPLSPTGPLVSSGFNRSGQPYDGGNAPLPQCASPHFAHNRPRDAKRAKANVVPFSFPFRSVIGSSPDVLSAPARTSPAPATGIFQTSYFGMRQRTPP